MTINKWLIHNTKSLQDKTVAITGSTGGLGKQICMHLAKLNANLLFLNRNKTKSETLKSQILENYPNIKIDLVEIDMQDTDSVKSACETLKKIDIDILILNAGALNLSRQKSSLGYDNVFQVNFISPYFLTKQLLPQLTQKKDSKIVAVGSIAHKYATLNEKDVDYTNETNGQKVYGNSKRFLMYSLYELFKKETKLKLSVVHPGITQTNITSNYPKILQPIIKLSMKLIYSSPKKAALSIINGIFTNTEHSTWIGPKFKNIWGYPKKSKLNSCSVDESKKIFKIAESIYKAMTKKQTESAKNKS